MDSGRRGKRKSPSQDIIFEVSDNDISSEDDCNEPEAKISKTDGPILIFNPNQFSNLELNKETLNVEISENQEQTISFEISEHISVSNSSTAGSSVAGSDIIVISEDNIDVVNDSEENYQTPRADSIENSENNSADSSEIIDITDENPNPVYLTHQDSAVVIEVNPACNIDENSVSLTVSQNTISVKDDEENNLEDGELDDSQLSVQVEEAIDVTKSPSVEIDVQRIDEDETDTKSHPCICISFSDEKMSELYKSKFLKFLEQFIELEVENVDNLTLTAQRDCMLNPSEWIVCDETICLSETKSLEVLEKLASPLPITPEKIPLKKKKKKKSKKELFVLDTNPSENENCTQFTRYSTKFQIDINEKPAENEITKISAQTCFNCDSNHSIKDCPLPKDFGKINAARLRFKAQKQTARYHLEEDQKYSHLIPGEISENLREALGLRKNQLPPFVYHMRMLGYPPGWLEEAKFVHSNLALFDTDGNHVRDDTTKHPGLDPEKIVNYPGFNIPIDKSMKDEYRQYRVPPFSETFSKQAMIEFFEKNFAKEQDNFETCDMDLDSTFEEKEKPVAMEMAEERVLVNPLLNDLKEIDCNLPSPSLTDLEKQKENLLAALEDNSSSNLKSMETTTCEDPENSSDQDMSKNNRNVAEKVHFDKPLEINIEKAQNCSTSFASPPLNSNVNCVKTSTFGTPILKSGSPYSSLPNADNFMKDVSPVINFENLPNSTGKYEQMTGVLQKVRNTLKGLQNCKS